HDKWLKFGLGLHTGIEPFSGRIMWIWVWHSNQNPQLILSYYLNTLEALADQKITGCKCSYNAATVAHPSLHGTLQHRWMQSKKNVMPEIAWMVFHWIFIPWLQQELDAYQDCVHNTAKQHDCNKISRSKLNIQLLDDDEDDEILYHFNDYQDLPSHKEPNGTYYMGGVGGGLGLDTEHLHQLDSLTDNDEPNITLGIDEDLVGLDHAGLVVWEFSDCESEDEMVNEW
ncbi:uncharacterized protein EDB93DRAFT_1109486, partial [Suillus bovinus]|uniref:uncharacterized protein n=1 Tax=Suillus bovinus TaxID=48563 RepID=UPI001B8860D8